MGIYEATLWRWPDIAVEKANTGRDEGGIPIGAALIGHDGQVHVLGDPRCIALMDDFIAAHPDTWNEDIGNE